MNLKRFFQSLLLASVVAIGASTCLTTTEAGEEPQPTIPLLKKAVKDPARPTISVPEEAIQASVGDFVIVMAKTDAKVVVWIVPDLSVLSRVPPSELVDKNKLIVACKRSGIHSIFAVAVDDEGRLSDQATVRINVKGGSPEPGPGPGPTPDVVLPDGKYKLAAFAFNAAKSYVKDDNDRVAGAAAIAKSLKGIVARIAAGTIKDPETALAELEVANASALRDAKVDRATWDSWGTALQKEWFPLYQNGKMKTLEDFSTAFKEVATGLEAVR